LKPFDITVGQAKAWSILSRSFQAGRTASAYLFYGPDGAGHWPLAVAFAALNNCEKPVTTDNPDSPLKPCGECGQCRLIHGLNSELFRPVVPVPTHKNLDEAIGFTNDVMEQKRLEPLAILQSSRPISIPVSMARDVQKSLSRKGVTGSKRVVLFYHMELMRSASADALLKLIEEPSEDVIIILTSPRPETLLPTIQSRCQQVRLGRVPEEQMVHYLTDRYGLSEQKATLFTRISGGIPGKALTLVDQQEEDELSRRATGFLLFKSLFMESGPRMVSLLTDHLSGNDRSEVSNLLSLWQSLIRDCAYYAVTADETRLVNVDFAGEIKKVSASFAVPSLSPRLIRSIKNTLADLQRNVHIHLSLVALSLTMKACIQDAA
jgi:DNA polymerase-3 subunit delta'